MSRKRKPAPTVVHCKTCPTCNGWGMLYEGRPRPPAVKS